MNVIEGTIISPVSVNARSETHLKEGAFNALLFQEDAVARNTNLSLLENKDIFSDHTLSYLNSKKLEMPDIENDKQAYGNQKLSVKAKSDPITVKVTQGQQMERKELHEQKLMPSYALSYIDVSYKMNHVGVASKDQLEGAGLVIKNQSDIEMLNKNTKFLLDISSSSAATRALLQHKNSACDGEVGVSGALLSKRYFHNEIIEKSNFVIGRQEENKSLYVRDHFSDHRTLSVVISDILSRLKFKIGEVIINGRRG